MFQVPHESFALTEIPMCGDKCATAMRAGVSWGRQCAFTLMELLVVVSIIALLATMLLGSIKLVREQAKSVKCLAGLRQVGVAKEAFALDHEAQLVPVISDDGLWIDVLSPYCDDTKVAGDSSLNKASLFGSCPSFIESQQRFTYASGWGFSVYPLIDEPAPDILVNVFSASGKTLWGNGIPTVFTLPRISYPTGRIMCADNWDYWAAGDNFDPARHAKRSNAVFFDGHAASLEVANAFVCWTNPLYAP